MHNYLSYSIVYALQHNIFLMNTPRFQIMYSCIDVSRRSSDRK